jgi:glucose-6-phosphate 1-dehydrogenase
MYQQTHTTRSMSWRQRQRMLDSDQSVAAADAFVFFGATGDLAHKLVFPALYQMVKRGTLGVPVVGVASSRWGLPQLRDRARDSIARTDAGIDDGDALDRLLSLLDYVAGDYGDPSTFKALGLVLGGSRRPVHYLAIPPSLFATVTEGLSGAGLTHDARVIVEKPFGRDLASARELNRVIGSAFPESAIFRGYGAEPPGDGALCAMVRKAGPPKGIGSGCGASDCRGDSGPMGQ